MKVIKVNKKGKNNNKLQGLTTYKKILLTLFTLMVLLITYGYFRQKHLEKYYAENGGFDTTTAICDKVGYKKSKQHSMPINYHFYVDEKKIIIKGETVPYRSPYTSLKKGDSLIVSYAILNPEFSDVIRVKK